MKKIILALVALVAFTGCTALEQTWSAGKGLGDKILSEDTKETLKPYVESVETLYGAKDLGKGVSIK